MAGSAVSILLVGDVLNGVRCGLLALDLLVLKDKQWTNENKLIFCPHLFLKKSKKLAYYKIYIKIQVDFSPCCFTRYKEKIKDWGR